MRKKSFYSLFIFLVIFLAISMTADFYYYNRVIQKDSSDRYQICYSDFRVLWYAAYNLRHYVLLENASRRPVFNPIWFLNPKVRDKVSAMGAIGEPDNYILYDKRINFYHYRYSPFIAFLTMPLGKILRQGRALMLWYTILNLSFLSALLIMHIRLSKDFNLSYGYRSFILWASFLASLRFYLMNISLGQTDILIAFLFVLLLTAYLNDKEILCGIFLALILHIKLFSFPILFYFLITGRKKIIASTIISFLCFLFIPSYMIGIEKTLEFLRAWIGILSVSIPSQILNVKNQSLVYAIGCLLLKSYEKMNIYVSPVTLFSTISAWGILSVCILMAWLKRHKQNTIYREYKYVELSLLIITSILFSPVAWESHFVILLIPLWVAMCLTLNSSDRQVLHVMLWIFFILSCVVGTDLTNFIPYLNKLKIANIGIGTIFLAGALIYGYKKSTIKTL